LHPHLQARSHAMTTFPRFHIDDPVRGLDGGEQSSERLRSTPRWSMRPTRALSSDRTRVSSDRTRVSSDRTRVVVEGASTSTPRTAPLIAGTPVSTVTTRARLFASPNLGAAIIPNVNTHAAVRLVPHMAVSPRPSDARTRKKLAQEPTMGHTHHAHESWTPCTVRFRT
jgi:hypothetical protein